jgi:hypothetical protein
MRPIIPCVASSTIHSVIQLPAYPTGEQFCQNHSIHKNKNILRRKIACRFSGGPAFSLARRHEKEAGTKPAS